MASELYHKTQTAADRALKVIFGDTGKSVVPRGEIDADRKLLSTFGMALREFNYGGLNKTSDGRSTESAYISENGRTRLLQLKQSAPTTPLPSLSASPTSTAADTALTASKQGATIGSRSVTPETVLRDIRELQRQLPSFNIVFKIEPKDQSM